MLSELGSIQRSIRLVMGAAGAFHGGAWGISLEYP